MKLTCKEASRLISLGLDRKLGFGERTALRLHFALCTACTRLNAQFQFMRQALSKYSGVEREGDNKSAPGKRDD